MNTMLKTLSAVALAGQTVASTAKAEVSEHFIIHELPQSPQEAATLIRDSSRWTTDGPSTANSK